MEPGLKDLFNTVFENDLTQRVKTFIRPQYQSDFAAAVEKAFETFVAGAAGDEITEERIEAFVEKIEDEGLREHVRIGLETARQNAREIIRRWVGTLPEMN